MIGGLAFPNRSDDPSEIVVENRTNHRSESATFVDGSPETRTLDRHFTERQHAPVCILLASRSLPDEFPRTIRVFSTTAGDYRRLAWWSVFIVCAREGLWASRNMSSAIRPPMVG